MSSHFTAQAWRTEVSTTAKLLLLYLCDNCDAAGKLDPLPVSQLAEVIRRNERTTSKALAELERESFLVRQAERWLIPFMPPSRLILRDPDAALESVPSGGENSATPLTDVKAGRDTESAQVDAGRNAEAEEPGRKLPPAPPAPDDPVQTAAEARFEQFAAAFDLDMAAFADAWPAWQTIEAREAPHNRKIRHQKDGEHWTVQHEAIDDLMPAILKAVDVYNWRRFERLPVHAETAAEFLAKELWLVPAYQNYQGSEARQYTEAELDTLVHEMNRQGGPYACNLLMSGKNPHTGEIEIETLEIYQKRVLAKYAQFQAHKGVYTE